MNWNKLTDISQLEEIKKESFSQPVLIFKHSTRCSISSMALDRLLRNWKEEDAQKIKPYYLDLIENRAISDEIEESFGVPHASPQAIVLKEGVAVYDNSHFGISYPDIMACS